MPEAEKFSKPNTYYDRLEIAQKIAQAFDDGFSWASLEKIKDLPLVHITKTVDLESWEITQQQYTDTRENYEQLLKIPFQHTDDPYADFRFNTRHSSEISRCEAVMERYENRRETAPMEIHVLRLGDVAFTSCSCELYMDYQHRIQARSPFVQTFMVQLTASDTAIGSEYLATERAAGNKGYSAIPYSCQISPAGGQSLVEQIVDTLNEIHKK